MNLIFHALLPAEKITCNIETLLTIFCIRYTFSVESANLCLFAGPSWNWRISTWCKPISQINIVIHCALGNCSPPNLPSVVDHIRF